MTTAPLSIEPVPLLSLRAISKRFGRTQALRDVDLDIYAGEVHALIGQNGSGKSTLIKILSGYHEPDPGGSLFLKRMRVSLPLTPAVSARLGLTFLHQDLGLANNLSVAENLFIGGYETGFLGRIRWRKERSRARALLGAFALDIDPDVRVGRLSKAEQALVGIVRAWSLMAEGGGVIVLDEPTAALPAREVDRLFGVLRELAVRGSSAVFVSHRLDEIEAVADRVSVLRDGRLVASKRARETKRAELVDLMLGSVALTLYKKREPTAVGAVALSVNDLTGHLAQDVSFTVRRGEVLGITGLVGMGQDEIPYLLCGARRRRQGTVRVEGALVSGVSPMEAFRRGIAILPQDRQSQGGFYSASMGENISASVIDRYLRRLWLDSRREKRDVLASMTTYGIIPAQAGRTFRAFSGGNQQKALLARCMETAPAVLVLHEPTQGVDVASRQHILAAIAHSAASKKVAVVLVSVEYGDLAQLCDRVLIINRGRIQTELSGDQVTDFMIARMCYMGSNES